MRKFLAGCFAGTLLLTAMACGLEDPNVSESGLSCIPDSQHPYNVTASMLPMEHFVKLADDRVCYAPDGYARPDTCAKPSIYWKRGPQCPDFTYCSSPYSQVEYRPDPLLGGTERLFCRQ